jgi:hypothetical protein
VATHLDPAPPRDLPTQQILQFLTTEHYTLQGAKSAIVAETTGRATIYLSSVSSAVVALAFTGQASQLSNAFRMFGIALFLPLFFLGIVTFVRVYETATESMLHARRINRIRHFYVELAPTMAPYVGNHTHDDMQDFFDELAIYRPPNAGGIWRFWQQMVSIAGAIAVVNAMIAGIFFGFVAGAATSLSLAPTIAVGAAVFVVTIALHVRYLNRKYLVAEDHFQSMFPHH